MRPGTTRLRAAAGRSASDISTALWSIPLLRSTWAVSHASFANMNNRPAIDPAAILFKGVGTWGAIAVAVAGMAPTMAMNLNPQEPAEHVGRVVPLVFLLSTVVVLLVAWCFARLAHEHPNAGSAYGFVAAILGPRAGLVAGWTLLGTYLCFAIVGLGAFGLFGANLLQRLDLWRDASSLGLTVLAAVVLAPLSIVPARRAGLVLIILEGVAVVAMVLMACAVLLLVAQGHGPQNDAPLRDLLVPAAGVGASAIAMGLSFGLLSFAGFEQVATLGEEVTKSRFTIPRVLIGTVLGAGVVFTLVTAAETLGFGTDRAGLARFTTSTSLLADSVGALFRRLVRRSVRWAGHLFRFGRRIGVDRGGLAHSFCAVEGFVAVEPDGAGVRGQRHAPRRRGLCPAGDDRRISRDARCLSSLGIGCVLLGLHARRARPAGRLSARGRQRRRRAHASVGAGHAMAAVHSRACRGGDRLHPLGERLSAAARRVSGDSMDCARLVLRTPDRDAASSPVARPGYLRLPGRGRPHEAGLTSQPRPATVRRALLMLLY